MNFANIVSTLIACGASECSVCEERTPRNNVDQSEHDVHGPHEYSANNNLCYDHKEEMIGITTKAKRSL